MKHRLGNAGFTTEPVGQVLCGAFVGARSRAMVASLTTPGCGGTIGWVVFRLLGRSWQIVMQRRNGAQLQAVGSNIRETQQVLRPGDAHCLPTGGTRSRLWHWNGVRFVTTPWKYARPPSNPPEFRVRLAGGTLGCDVAVGQTLCQAVPSAPQASEPLVQVARLQPDGQATSCVARGLADDHCLQGDLGDPIPDLSAGQQTTVGPFTCTVLEAGVRCTVTATGKGFLITPASVTLVGG